MNEEMLTWPEGTRFRYDLRDESAKPVIAEYGFGTEEKVSAKVQRHYPRAYFEQQGDGRILIFRNEKEATTEANSIGSIRRLTTMDRVLHT